MNKFKVTTHKTYQNNNLAVQSGIYTVPDIYQTVEVVASYVVLDGNKLIFHDKDDSIVSIFTSFVTVERISNEV